MRTSRESRSSGGEQAWRELGGLLPETLRARAESRSDLEAIADELAAWLAAQSAEALAAPVKLLVSLGEPAVEVLQRAGERAPDRARRKLLRTALHQLRSRGVEIESGPRGGERSVLHPVEPDAGEQAFATPIDPAGSRLLVLAHPAHGEICEIGLSDTLGVLHLEEWSGRRRNVRQALRELRARGAVAIEPGALRALAQRAESERSGARPTGVDAQALARILAGPLASTPGESARARLAGQTLEDSAADAVLRERMSRGGLAPWPLDPQRTLEAYRRIDAVAHGRLVLPPLEKREREGEARRAAAVALLDAEARERLARRLEETAHLWLVSGDEKGALAAVQVAGRLRDAAADPLRVEFAHSVFELSLELAARNARDEDRGRLIVEPGR